MKKIISVILVMLMIATAFAGCKNNNTIEENTENIEANEVLEPVEETEVAEDEGDEVPEVIASNEKTEEPTEKKVVEKGTSEEVTPKEAKTFIDKEKYEVIIDIRTREEYEKEHIKGAINLPKEMLKRETITMLIPKTDQPLMVYGSDEKESMEVAENLAEMGYQTVKSIGTIEDWEYETEKK